MKDLGGKIVESPLRWACPMCGNSSKFIEKVVRLVAAVKNSQNDPLGLAKEIGEWPDE